MTFDLYNWLYNVCNYLIFKKINVRITVIWLGEDNVPFTTEKINVDDIKKSDFTFEESVIFEMIGKEWKTAGFDF